MYSSETPKNFIESDVESQELNLEQKRALADSWLKMVIGSGEAPENIEEMDTGQIREWMYRTLMNEVEDLVEEWNLEADENLIAKIQNERDLDKKSKLELEYIKLSHSLVDEMAQNFNKSEQKNAKWDSWPAKMKKSKKFNCVGATLLGINFLEKARIKSYCGIPHGHVLNIAKLSNNEWWYVDFRNGKKSVLKIEPEETKLADLPVLEIDNPNIDYQLIPLLKNSEAPGFILGNFSDLKKEVKNPEIPDRDIEKKEVINYVSRFENQFDAVDFSALHQILYPESIEVEKIEEMKEEITYIDQLRNYDKPVEEYIKTLTREQKAVMIEDIKRNLEGIKNLFYNDNQEVFSIAGTELKEILELSIDSFRTVGKNEPETYQKLIQRLINRISSL